MAQKERDRIERCIQGDKLAFREFYDLYNKAMFNIALRILGNTGEAEDILQDAFVKSFRLIGTVRSDLEFGGFLKRVVINASIDQVRKRRIDFHSLDEARYVAEEPEEETDYDIALLRECLRQLPDGFRIVLTLYLFENYSHREIGSLLNISEGTSKSQYLRARRKLAELYAQKTRKHA